MVEIRRVKSRRDRKKFINFENKLYSKCECFVPTIYKDEISMFSYKKNPNIISNESTGYLAYQDGKVVGRVLCTFNRIEKDKKNIIRFSHLDFVNDSEVSFALLDVVEKWATFLKSDKIIGDISFNDISNIGILNSGYDKFATFHHRYNYPYYVNHLKDYGYSQSKKLKEYQLKIKEEHTLFSEDIEDSQYKIVSGDKFFKIKNYGRKVFDLLYNNSISGYPIVIEEGVYERFFKNLNKLFSDDDFVIVVNESDDVVGAMLLTNNTSIALQTTDGKELASNNYNVDIENHKYVDLSLYVIADYEKETVENIMINYLIKSMNIKNNKYINMNLWLSDYKSSVFAYYFTKSWSRERVIMSKSLKTNIRRAKEDLVNPNNIANNSIVK